MYLEEKKTKKLRINHWRAKEWWYSGCYDEKLGIYFSFYFSCVNVIDFFNFTLFDPNLNQPKSFSKYIILDSKQEKEKLDLKFESKGIKISYFGDEETGWKFIFNSKHFEVVLEIKKTIPCFTKFDNNFTNVYTLLHYMQNTVNGTVRVDDHIYDISNACGYYDHCFGTVPRRVGWHWVAVQNKDVALASLVNYGPYPQKYTHVFFNKGKHSGKWIRLNQDVSYEYDPDNKIRSKWKLTSCDLDMEITPIMNTKDIIKVPPWIPVLINITHYEFYIKISGSVRVDAEWIPIENLSGVLEEHYGIW